MSADDIKTLADFETACAGHDLTYSYSDDPRWYRKGCAEYAAIREAANKFPRADVERIWNKQVDRKLVEHARESFYWRWPAKKASEAAI
jgi:predicted site-specific integrase-resolvase